MMKVDLEKPLTRRQMDYVDAYFKHGGKTKKAIADAAGVSVRRAYQLSKHPRIQAEIARKENMLLKFADGAANNPVISKHQVADLYMEIAAAGSERGFDKEGNSVMVNPGAANTALAGIAGLYGYNAPTETIETKIERSEVEISANIQSLQAEFNKLLALENDVIDVTPENISID